MSSSNLIRWGGLAAMVAGVLWVMFGVLNTQPLGTSHTAAPFTVRDPSLYRIYHLPAALGTLLAATGVLGLGRRLAQPAGLLARVGSLFACIAAVGGAVNALALAALVISLHFAGAMIGAFTLAIGTTLIGVAALSDAGLRRWRALPLALGVLGVLVFPVSMLTFGGPAELLGVALITVFGLGWAAMGYALYSSRGLSD